MSTEQNKQRVRQAVEAFNRGDLDAYLRFYADDATLHDLGIEPGLENIRRFYEAFLQAFPDLQVTTEDLIAEGDRVAERVTLRGTHQGPFQGLPATGKRIELNGITILRFQEGLCVERWTQADFLGLLQQLGAIPLPEPATLSRTIYDLFSRNELTRVFDYVADDVEAVLVPFGQTFRGKDGFMAFMRGFKDAFPDIQIQVTNQVVSGDQVVNEFTAHGMHTGVLQTPAGPVPPTGRKVDFTVCEVLRWREGRLVSLHNYQDAASLMRQLGLFPEPAPA